MSAPSDDRSTLLEVIRTRRVTRSFTDRPVSRGDIELILESARWAPNGGNRRLNVYIEVAVPLLVEEKEFLTDSGGAGRHRGGLGQRMSFRLLEGFDGMATVAAQPMGQRVPPFGLKGATAATTADIMINGRVLSREENLGLAGALDLIDSNLVVSIDTAGGGGFGPPEERDAVRVREDVRNEIVSLQQATQIYHVVIDPATLTIDEASTSARRKELSARRLASTREPLP